MTNTHKLRGVPALNVEHTTSATNALLVSLEVRTSPKTGRPQARTNVLASWLPPEGEVIPENAEEERIAATFYSALWEFYKLLRGATEAPAETETEAPA